MQTDIFKHTFVDAENLNQDEEEGSSQITQIVSYILPDKKPKDVFTYKEMSMELPNELFKNLGDYTIASSNQKAMMKEFLIQHYPDVSTTFQTLTIFIDEEKALNL